MRCCRDALWEASALLRRWTPPLAVVATPSARWQAWTDPPAMVSSVWEVVLRAAGAAVTSVGKLPAAFVTDRHAGNTGGPLDGDELRKLVERDMVYPCEECSEGAMPIYHLGPGISWLAVNKVTP